MFNTSLTSYGPQWRKKPIFFGSIMMICGLVLTSLSVGATEPPIPWQCTSYTYTGNSQLECIQSLSNDQESKIAKLERQLKRQEIVINELKAKIDRQARRPDRGLPAYQPSYDFVPSPPPLGIGPLPIYGYGQPLGFGVGPLPFLPPIAIVID